MYEKFLKPFQNILPQIHLRNTHTIQQQGQLKIWKDFFDQHRLLYFLVHLSLRYATVGIKRNIAIFVAATTWGGDRAIKIFTTDLNLNLPGKIFQKFRTL